MAASKNRVVIIGAGHNGLVAAYYLARAGFSPLVLERRDTIGGAVVNEEIHAGFHCPALAHSLGPLLPNVSAELQLERHGFSAITPEISVLALSPGGRPIPIFRDVARTAREIGSISSHDGKAYTDFHASFAAIGNVLAPLMSMTPPTINEPTKAELWNLGKVGLKFRGLSNRDAFRLLRWGPMAVADLAAEWFETELLRAVVAARGIAGTFAGPWSAGTSAPVLFQAALSGTAIAPAIFAKGGIGSLTQCIAKAATSAGAQIRTSAGIQSIRVKSGKTTGVVLTNGEEISTSAVVSNADPKTTYLHLLDPTDLDPEFRFRIQNYKSRGTAGKVNLALSALPAFNGISDQSLLNGRTHIGPEIDYLEHAFDTCKYGDFSPHPYMDIVIPSLTDPSLAPKGGHVMSIYVQYAPYKLAKGDWNGRRDEFAESVINTLAEYAPNIRQLIVGRQVLTPLDLEQEYGLNGGHIFHGEPSLDQLFTFRPMLGFAQYRTPIQGLYLCGAGTHPGGGVTGAPGFNASREVIKDLKKQLA
jgi:phytoene dehydrogenase-like protein